MSQSHTQERLDTSSGETARNLATEESPLVSDFKTSVRWYKEKLGFREKQRWTSTHIPGVELAYLELNDFGVEIVGSQEGQAAPAQRNLTEHLQTKGHGRLCFAVDSVDAVLAELNRRGVPTFRPAAMHDLARIIHGDSRIRVKLAKQIVRSSEKA